MACEPVIPSTRHRPLHDTASTRQIEQLAAATLAPGALMQAAGAAVARWVRALHPHGRRAWVAAGPGGNGGDGLHAAAELATMGWHVSVALVGDAERLSPDAALGLQRARAAGVHWTAPEHCLAAEADVALDALLGLGISRPPSAALAQAISRLNALRRQGVPVLSIDLPSGLHPDTGTSMGEHQVTADATLSLLTLKPGLVTGDGRALAGSLWLDDLDTGDHVSAVPHVAQLGGAPWLETVQFDPNNGAHKGHLGDALVIGGGHGMLGAARLAAHAAQAAGAGRTIVSLLDPQAPSGDVLRPEWIWAQQAWTWSPRELARCSVVCGCGAGEAVAEVLPPLLAQTEWLVLDADALNAVSQDPGLQTLLADRASRGQATVLTPHPLEAARLLGVHTLDIQADRLRAAASLASRFHAVALLKGPGTVICAPGSKPWINSTGNSALAHGGSGDVLAGWIGGLLAQYRQPRDPGAGRPTGSPAGLWDVALRCACAAAWLHGAAADRCPAQASRARDLVNAMHRIAFST